MPQIKNLRKKNYKKTANPIWWTRMLKNGSNGRRWCEMLERNILV